MGMKERFLVIQDSPLMFVVAILFFMLIAFLEGFYVCKKYYARGYYESGAHAVMIHHKYRGTYGSRAYRDAAFEWGDPQDEEDLNKIYAYMFAK